MPRLKKDWKKKTLSHDPRVYSSLKKAMYQYVLVVHRCPKMNLTYREHKRNITVSSVSFSSVDTSCCDTWQNMRSFHFCLFLTLHRPLLKFHLLTILSSFFHKQSFISFYRQHFWKLVIKTEWILYSFFTLECQSINIFFSH